MSLPPVVRVFFAVDFPPAIKEELGHFMGELKKKSKPHTIRWVKPENLHITLQFLAEIKIENLSLLINNVRENLAGKVNQAILTLGGLRLFPSPYRPRVIVLDMAPQKELAILSGLIGQSIRLSHYEVDARPFYGHVTLGRIKQPQELDSRFLPTCLVPTVEKVVLNEVVLFRSEPQPEGSRYTVVERIPLLLNRAHQL